MKIWSSLLVCTVIYHTTYGQIDSARSTTHMSVGPQVEGIQADFIFGITSGIFTAAIDLNGFAIAKPNHTASIGIRTGVEFIYEGSFGGSSAGSPLIDYDLLARLTGHSPNVRADIFCGYTKRTFSEANYEQNLLKYGFEGKWLFIGNAVGLVFTLRVTPGSPRQIGKGSLGLVMYLDF